MGRDPAEIERSIGGIEESAPTRLDRYLDAGVTHLIMETGGPEWDLSLLPKLVEWRDSRRS